MEDESKKPLRKFRVGNVTAAVWKNEGQNGASLAFADLTVPSPAFGVVSLPEVQALNPLVGAMIR